MNVPDRVGSGIPANSISSRDRFSNAPGIPYEGEFPYIFISYSHSEWESVFPLVKKLMDDGYRVWYDEGIECGAEWRAVIQDHVEGCAVIIPFLSAAYCESRNCRSEISMAYADEKHIIPVYIEDAKLTHGVRTSVAGYQGIFAYKAPNGETAYRQLVGAQAFKRLSTKVQKVAQEASPDPRPASPNEVHIATFDALRKLGMTPLEIATRLVENDRNLYPDISDENEGAPEQWAEYLSSYPETFRYVINAEGQIVGNWSFLAVSEDTHGDLLRSGELLEEQFSLDNTEFLFFPGDYVGYLLNLSLNEGYATTQNYNLLFEALADQLVVFAEKGIFFREWYVNVFRRDHAAMYKSLGFHYLCKNRVFGDLYQLSYTDHNSRIMKSNEKLRRMYMDHYE